MCTHPTSIDHHRNAIRKRTHVALGNHLHSCTTFGNTAAILHTSITRRILFRWRLSGKIYRAEQRWHISPTKSRGWKRKRKRARFIDEFECDVSPPLKAIWRPKQDWDALSYKRSLSNSWSVYGTRINRNWIYQLDRWLIDRQRIDFPRCILVEFETFSIILQKLIEIRMNSN